LSFSQNVIHFFLSNGRIIYPFWKKRTFCDFFSSISSHDFSQCGFKQHFGIPLFMQLVEKSIVHDLADRSMDWLVCIIIWLYIYIYTLIYVSYIYLLSPLSQSIWTVQSMLSSNPSSPTWAWKNARHMESMSKNYQNIYYHILEIYAPYTFYTFWVVRSFAKNCKGLWYGRKGNKDPRWTWWIVTTFSV